MTKRAVILFAALGIAWGIPYLLIKIAVGELDPAVVVFGRSAIGALLLLPLAIYRKQVWVVLKRWRPLLVYTAVEIVIPWFFLSTAELRLPSSTAGLLLAVIPLVGVAVAFFFGRPAKLSGGNWIGIVLGMLGVAALVGLDVAGSDLIGVAAADRRGIGYAIGPAILSRWMSDLPGSAWSRCRSRSPRSSTSRSCCSPGRSRPRCRRRRSSCRSCCSARSAARSPSC